MKSHKHRYVMRNPDDSPKACEHEACDKEVPQSQLSAVDVEGGSEQWCQECRDYYLKACEHEGCDKEVSQSQLSAVDVEGRFEQWCQECRDESSFKCAGGCDSVCSEDDSHAVTSGGSTYTWCNGCADGSTSTCVRCEDLVPDDETTEVQVRSQRRLGRRTVTQTWCDSCAEDHTFACDRCHVIHAESDGDHEVSGNTWCQPCYEDHGSYCERHGVGYDMNSGCGDCEEDHGDEDEDEDDDSQLIRGYHSTKSEGFNFIESPWVEAQPKPLYFGVELEVEVPLSEKRDDYAQAVKHTMGELLAGIEEDGSLTHGFEIITQPAGLDTHRIHWANANLKGLKSHDTSTCGLHVHVTSKALSKLTLGKMMEFTDSLENRQFLVVFARRAFNTYALHANKKISDAARTSNERREAWNTTNPNTVEFRLSKGTTKKTTILATIEFVYALIRFCELSSAKNLNSQAFRKFLVNSDAWLCETRFLRAYLVDRGLARVEDMRLPRIKTGTVAVVEDAAPTENPSRASGRMRSYADLALEDYLRNGEDTTELA